MRSVRIYNNINLRVLAIIGEIKIKAKILLMLVSLLILTSCYASGNLGVMQKVNDVGTVINGISEAIKNTKD